MNLISFACVTCQANSVFGGSDAIGWSIFFLLVMILGVVGSVVFFMVRLAIRANREAQIEQAITDV